MSFSDYVELALYHEKYGYYASPAERIVGKKGDFFTSVSVGEMFGFLLAGRIAAEWSEKLDSGRPLVVVEQGAHDGQLAADITSALAANPDVENTKVIYRIIEPRRGTREFLKNRFHESEIPVEVVRSPDEAKAKQGVFLCNELLDAFSFDRMMLSAGEWKELRVTLHHGNLAWTSAPARTVQKNLLPRSTAEFPENYVTEICPALFPWMSGVSQLFEKGLWWIIDYGYESDDYFAPGRKSGTLRCYRKHEATEDPFSFPGETDITAHVNFSHLQQAATGNGLEWRNFTDQHHFLIHAAKAWLLSLEGRPADDRAAKRLRQFQTLTHPGLMGQQFKVAEMTRGL